MTSSIGLQSYQDHAAGALPFEIGDPGALLPQVKTVGKGEIDRLTPECGGIRKEVVARFRNDGRVGWRFGDLGRRVDMTIRVPGCTKANEWPS